jgi:hypothetical protein
MELYDNDLKPIRFHFQHTHQCLQSSGPKSKGDKSMAVNFTVFVCRGKLWNMSPISRSDMSVFPLIILSNKLMDGRQNNGAQTRSLSSFVPTWKTILQSSFPSGTAKY